MPPRAPTSPAKYMLPVEEFTGTVTASMLPIKLMELLALTANSDMLPSAPTLPPKLTPPFDDINTASSESRLLTKSILSPDKTSK